MAGYNSNIHDPIDDLISDCEAGNRKLSISQLNRLLNICEKIEKIGKEDPFNKKGFFVSQLECNQAQCNIVQMVRIKALLYEADGKNSDEFVLSFFTDEAKRKVLEIIDSED